MQFIQEINKLTRISVKDLSNKFLEKIIFQFSKSFSQIARIFIKLDTNNTLTPYRANFFFWGKSHCSLCNLPFYYLSRSLEDTFKLLKSSFQTWQLELFYHLVDNIKKITNTLPKIERILKQFLPIPTFLSIQLDSKYFFIFIPEILRW